MKHIKLIIIIILLSNVAHSQPNIIFDTDFGGDADDLGALAMLHHFIDKNECNLLAIVSWSTANYTIAAIDAVNRFYGHPDIPLGTRKPPSDVIDWNYSRPIAKAFPYQLTHNSVIDAVSLYRKILSENADSSITIVTVGPLKNIQDLLQSPPDSISILDGKTLVHQKVKEFVIMGGNFPQGEWEWNFSGNMKGVTTDVINHIQVPVVFLGYELGLQIKTGRAFNKTNKNSPLYIGFRHFSEHAPWMKKNFTGEILDNASYDQTAVLYAVRNGTGTYWNKVENGICIPDDNGGNTWEEKPGSNHAYLTLKMDAEEMSLLIEALMLGEF